MPELGFKQLIDIATTLGVTGLVLLLWYLSAKDNSKFLAAYREDTQLLCKKYDDDMREMRRMYENNVKLVERVTQLAQDLKETVLLNTQKWQQTYDAIMANQYCPLSELRRQPKEPK